VNTGEQITRAFVGVAENSADWQGAMGRILAEWGRLDISVNCARIAFARPVTDTSLADWRRAHHQHRFGGGHQTPFRQGGMRQQHSRRPVLHAHHLWRMAVPSQTP
jgi:NAD(P)-dependent dehydrogenase (short-subunit alcohol dehydrogenase family)